MVPVVGVDHAPSTSEPYTLSPGPPFSVPVSGLIPVPGPASGRGLVETPPTVSDHAVLTIIVANYCHLAHAFGP